MRLTPLLISYLLALCLMRTAGAVLTSAHICRSQAIAASRAEVSKYLHVGQNTLKVKNVSVKFNRLGGPLKGEETDHRYLGYEVEFSTPDPSHQSISVEIAYFPFFDAKKDLFQCNQSSEDAKMSR